PCPIPGPTLPVAPVQDPGAGAALEHLPPRRPGDADIGVRAVGYVGQRRKQVLTVPVLAVAVPVARPVELQAERTALDVSGPQVFEESRLELRPAAGIRARQRSRIGEERVAGPRHMRDPD